MQRRIRKFAWLMLASLAVLGLTVGAVLAHEGRPVGDYRLIVGWQHEPAYEGFQNAVSIRVNKIVEGEGDDHDHDDHNHDSTPEATETADSHDHDDHNQDSTPEATETADSHDHDTVAAGSAMSLEVEAFADSVSGVNVHLITTGFTFNASSVNGEHVDGEGHAHVYVDGVKITRVYTPWVYLGEVEPGKHEIRVTLNANHHPEYTWNGHVVEDVTTISVPEPHGHTHGPETVEADALMAVPVKGLEGSLQVEVNHVSSGESRIFDLQAVWEDPGHYSAGLIPTASGVYEFRFFGAIEETPIDETFVSQGGGGDFDDVQSSADLQFPVQLPELREIESGARGALSTAQEAQDTAIAAQEAASSGQGDGGNALAIVALVIGIVGAALGAGGIFMALRVRQPQA